MRLVWRARALSQLDAICSYIAADNPKAASDVREAIEHTASLLATFPHLGPPTTNRPMVQSKTVHRYPYRIFYVVLPDRDEVRIIRARDVRRRASDRA